MVLSILTPMYSLLSLRNKTLQIKFKSFCTPHDVIFFSFYENESPKLCPVLFSCILKVFFYPCVYL